MTKITVFSNKGAKTKEIEPAFAKAQINLIAVGQAVRVYTDHLHSSLSRVKTRGEVKISTRKIYRQKGTGNARHGAKSAPIFVGGGIAHGPKGLKRLVSLSKNIKGIALESALSLKAKEKGLVLVEGLSNFKKTSEAAVLIAKVKKELNVKDDIRVTVVLPVGSKAFAFRNIKNVLAYSVNSLNALRIFDCGVVVMDSDAINYFEQTKKEVKTKEEKESKAEKVITKTTLAKKKAVAKKKVVSKPKTKGGKK